VAARYFFEVLLVTAAGFCSTETMNPVPSKAPVFAGVSPCEPAGERFFMVGA
jgi:hypothetical protein